jgi:hypothetical protein
MLASSEHRRVTMARISPEFGKLIKDFLVEQGLTFRAAGFKSSLSAAYWKDMSDGRVPSEEVIDRIAETFTAIDQNGLRSAAGYAPVISNVDAVKAVEFALRGQAGLSDLGKKKILDFVRKIEEKYAKKG